MSQTGYEHLSNEELLALLQQGGQVQPVDAKTGEPLPPAQAQAYQQGMASGEMSPLAPPGTPMLPRAQRAPQDAPAPGEFYIDPQGQMHRQEQQGLLGRTMGAASDITRAIARGVPALGAYTDEADAATAALVAPVAEPALRHAPAIVQRAFGYDPRMEISGEGDFQHRYAAAKNMQALTDQTFDQEHPVGSPILQGAGAVAGTLSGMRYLTPLSSAAIDSEAGLLMRSGAAALEGAGVGAVDGYGRGQGGFLDPSRVQGAGVGALVGGGLGAAAPVAGHMAGQAWRATGGLLVDAVRGQRVIQIPPPSEEVTAEAERLARVLRGEEPAPTVTPEGPQAAVGDPQRLAQVIEARVGRASAPEVKVRASEEDDAYRRLARAFQRGGQTPDEAGEAVEKLGPFGVLADSSEATRDLMRAAINRPGRGSTIARENLTPRQQGVFNAEAGDYRVRPSSLRLVDEAASGMGLQGREFHQEMRGLLEGRKAAAGPAYATAYEAPPVDIGEFRDFAGSPLFRQAYDRARGISEKEFIKLPDGTEVIQPLPERFTSNEALDWRTLDLMKQGLDDLIKEGKVQGIGANEQGAIKGYLQRFVDKLDSLNPAYKAARDAFAGPTAMTEALDAGRAALTEDAPVLAANLEKLSDSEKLMYRLGALQALETKLGNANVTYDAANQAGFLKPNQLKRFRELFPTAQSFTDFYRAMERERTMFGTNTAAFGNSTTAKQLLNVMEPSDPQLEGVGQVIAGAAIKNPGSIITGIRQMGMESPMREGTAEALVSVLTNPDKARLAETIERIRRAQWSATAEDAVRRAQGTGAAQAGAAATRRKD